MADHVVYNESKPKAALKAFIFLALFFVLFIYSIFADPKFVPLFSSIALGWGVTFLFIVIFLFLYPQTRLEIFKDRMVYTRGKKKIEARWEDVTQLAVEMPLRSSSTPGFIFFDTAHGTTRLMDIGNFTKESGGACALDSTVGEIERISGKKFIMGEISVNKYSTFSYQDYKLGNS